jgi:outer membrane protein OmpA-like peptidoglycan-associated protein
VSPSLRTHCRTRNAWVGAVLLLAASSARADERSDAQTSQPAFDDDPLPTKPGEFSLKTELGFSFPLNTPQSNLFQLGGSESLKALWALSRYFDLGPSATYLVLPTQADTSILGTAWAFGGSLQFKRPHDARDDSFFGISPWIDGDALYVRTGPLDRFGLAVAAGLAVPLSRSRVFWLGPFVRYFVIVQPGNAGYNNASANTLTIGLSLDVTPGVKRPIAPEIVTVATVSTVTSCADRDHDGVPDSVDVCPDVPGPWENYGCPAYKKIVVKRDKLELTEKIQFAWNEATLLEASFGLLDEVSQALIENKTFRVQVEGNTSAEGTEEHNQTLSEARAQAVLDYLVAHGVPRERLDSKGFASTVPVASNNTEAGREANRRVEFVVHFNILNTDGSK